MEWASIVTVLALIEYLTFGILVGRARVAHGIKAPAISGHPIFERYFRVHQNTGEQLWVFLPSLWLFSHYVNDALAGVLGAVWLIGRALYLRGYVADPDQRGMGFLIGFLASSVLLLGSLFGAIRAVLSGV
jgi:glutathione S-transferase